MSGRQGGELKSLKTAKKGAKELTDEDIKFKKSNYRVGQKKTSTLSQRCCVFEGCNVKKSCSACDSASNELTITTHTFRDVHF
ncbi:hypothetical protein L596_007180 [Steinernema carpocapsae]|uniref:Translation machinery-associated protein 7 homolog n=1 Tax=Steinernema carpocapsae TaxID=34508 RepID=A0A4U5P8W9_STECR|nr:hypothetical protein L596_007180 [Steinernema carpocapsae]